MLKGSLCLVQAEAVGEKGEGIQCTILNGLNSFPDAVNILLRIAFMGADHVDAPPVKQLYIHISHAVLMESCHDQFTSLCSKFYRQVQGPFFPGCFNNPLTEIAAGKLIDFFNDLKMLIQGDTVICSGFYGCLQGEFPP